MKGIINKYEGNGNLTKGTRIDLGDQKCCNEITEMEYTERERENRVKTEKDHEHLRKQPSLLESAMRGRENQQKDHS